jgi:HAD superfamily hydrolase (TIGR01509 family)
MVAAAIFDIDGTLVDSVDCHAAAWQAAMRAHGREVRYAEVRAQIGKGGDQLLPVFFSPHELARLGPEIEAQRAALYKRDYMPKVRAFPRTRELFERIRADGVRIALASSSPGDELGHYKRLARIEDLVDVEVSKDDVAHSKPSPDVFAAALGKLGLGAEACVAIGDTPYDAQAAGKLGLKTIGVLCGGFPQGWLREAGCAAIFRDPADLLARYQSSPLAAQTS